MKQDNNPFSEENKNTEEDTNKKTDEQNAEKAETSTDSAKSEETEKLKKELEELNSLYIRMAADFDNYRKRQAQEREALLKYGKEDTLKKLLPLLDTFDRAQKCFDEETEISKIKDCVDVIYKQLSDTVDKMGLKVIDTKDQKFDPNFHEAVMQTPTSDYEENTIIAELQKGYRLDDRVIRPAMVNVATEQ